MPHIPSTMKKTLLFTVCFLAISVFGQVPNYVPSNGLLAYWPFSGNADDQTTNANHF